MNSCRVWARTVPVDDDARWSVLRSIGDEAGAAADVRPSCRLGCELIAEGLANVDLGVAAFDATVATSQGTIAAIHTCPWGEFSRS